MKLVRSIWEIAKFVILLVVVLLILQHFDVVDIAPGQVSVIDGDSLRQGKTEIRLHGIDAPEFRQMCKDSEKNDYPCGQRAAEALKQILRHGQLNCRSFEIDRYGRSVSSCIAGELDVNREMVARGWALAFTQFGADYLSVEKAAKLQKVGVWSGSFEEPSKYRQRLRSINGDMVTLQDLQPD